MRIAIHLRPLEMLTLTPHYNEVLQGFIYHNIDRALARQIHHQGFTAGTRTFRLFTFSRLQGEGRYDAATKKLAFAPGTNLSFQIASSQAELLSSLADTMLKESEVRLGMTPCAVREIAVPPPPPRSGGAVTVRALSAITVYSTDVQLNGHKRTRYYAPHDAAWPAQVTANLRHKAIAAGWDPVVLETLETRVSPLRVRPQDRKVAYYRDTVIEAWMGTYRLELPPALLELALDTGLGSKNSQGFGMVELIDA